MFVLVSSHRVHIWTGGACAQSLDFGIMLASLLVACLYGLIDHGHGKNVRRGLEEAHTSYVNCRVAPAIT